MGIRASLLCLLVLLAGVSPDVWAKDRVIVLAGQSNMMGRGRTADLPAGYKQTPPNVEYFSQGRPQPLAKFAYFGPEVSLAHELAKAFPQDHITLVKQAASGSHITQWQAGQALYKGLLRQIGFADQVRNFNQVDAIVWMQGESDAQSDLTIANQYGANLMQLVKHLRQDLASPNSVFVYGQVDLAHPAFNQAIQSVRTQQQSVQNQLGNAVMVSTANLAKLNDGIHYNAAGQLELGKRFAQALIARWK